MGGSGGAGGTEGGGTGGGGTGGVMNGQSSQLDLLLVIDDSSSTGISQQRLADSVGDLIDRLTNPDCVAPDGSRSTPADPSAECAAGERVHAPVSDLNIAMITSSLGSVGSSICEDRNDHAHLVPTVRSGVSGASSDGVFELREGSDVAGFKASLQGAIRSVGQSGCGYEMPLEAMYRFLVEPAPYDTIVPAPCNANDTQNSCVAKEGIDDQLLAQRKAFLRPGSTVGVVVVGDENDCSVQAGGQYWLALDINAFVASSTATCQTDPNDPCCYACAMAQQSGCPDKSTECSGVDPFDDNPSLRCWEQKRRMGIDFMYPLERYVLGLHDRTLAMENSDPTPQPNPLFVDGKRSPDQVHLLVLGGAPPEYLTETGVGGEVRYRTNAEISSAGLWPTLIGDPTTYSVPTDPFMVESPEQRSGTSSINGLSPADVNAVNGGDLPNIRYRLQFACIDQLPAPVDCDPEGCLCESSYETSICDSAYAQTAVPAYPTLRQFAVAKDSGGEIASLCQYGMTPGRIDRGFGASYELLQQALKPNLR